VILLEQRKFAETVYLMGKGSISGLFGVLLVFQQIC